MVLFELVGSEQNPHYQKLAVENGDRQYDFLRSIVEAAIALNRTVSLEIIKALNNQAISCLHVSAGEFRPCNVTVGNHQPCQFWQVQAQMESFVDEVNRAWDGADPVVLAAFALWKLNFIHPFINGNGRTARAVAYFILCVKSGGWLPGQPILPELLTMRRPDYVKALQAADASLSTGALDFSELHKLLSALISQQIASVGPPPPAPPPPAAPLPAP
jgi:Fic family protein